MRLARRKITFSSVSVLERLWIKKSLKTPALLREFPGLSPAVLHRTLIALKVSGLVRSRITPYKLRKGRPPTLWKLTERGAHVLRSMTRYRDLWEIVDNRDIGTLSAAIKIIEILEREYRDLFQKEPRNSGRGPYFAANDFWHNGKNI